MKVGMPKDGRFGDFGGKYIPETLVPAIEELEENYQKFKNCLLYTSPSPRDGLLSRMPSSA